MELGYLGGMKSAKNLLFPLYQVDAFASKPFTGNPAAVVFLMAPMQDAWLQAFAKEMNLSETAYFMRSSLGFQLRWFTPGVEVDLCGHATLATAHVIWETGILLPEEIIQFETRSGILTAKMEAGLIWLDFPIQKPEKMALPTNAVEAIGQEVLWAGKNDSDIVWLLKDEAAVRAAQPNFDLISKLDSRGLIITAQADDKEFDFVSRFFGPAVGVDEDPVTGSAHCALAPFWAERLGKTSLNAWQASERGGALKLMIKGERLLIGGSAVTVFQGVVAGSAF